MSATSTKTGGGTSVGTATDSNSAGAGIQQLTSTGGTVAITNPTGPVTNLEAAAAAGVTSVNTLVGALVLSGDAALKFAAAGLGIVVSQFIAAEWTVGVATRRVFLVDGVNGNDANPGFLDGGASVFPISGPTLAATAKKTVAGLAAVFPRLGNGRQAEIIIARGTYTDSLALLLTGVTGYAAGYPIVRGTATSATAGCTAFDGSTADNTMLGAVTVTGLNAAGYSPTGAATNQVVTCTQLGGADPAFAGEPAAPLGWRIRFDSATSTAALRNVCRGIAAVADNGTVGTLTTWTALPAVPTAADVFYIEQAGVLMPGGLMMSAGTLQAGSVGGQRSIQLAGIQCNTALDPIGSSPTFVFCGITGNSGFFGGMLTGIVSLSSADHGTIVVGSALVNTGNLFAAGCVLSIGNIVITGTVSLEACVQLNIHTFVSRDFQVTGTIGSDSTSNFLLGSENQAGTGQLPSRILGTGAAQGLSLINSKIVLGQIDISGVGAHSAVVFNESDALQHPATGGTALTGSTGNTSVGMNLVGASKYVKNFASPHNTVTGTTGDVSLGALTTSWASLETTGIVYITGDRIVGPNGPVHPVAKFSGGILGSAGATTSYMADTGAAPAANLTSIDYATSMRLITRLRFKPESNNFATTVTATLFQNGAATTITVNIPAGTTAVVSDTAHTVLFADGDTFALVLANAGDAAKTLFGTAILEGPI